MVNRFDQLAIFWLVFFITIKKTPLNAWAGSWDSSKSGELIWKGYHSVVNGLH